MNTDMKNLLKTCCYTFLLAGCIACEQQPTNFSANGSDQAQTEERPNVVFILVDDLGYGQLGMTGQTKISTPNIDNLAQSGLSFTQAYSGGSVCSPSRVSLLTGMDGRTLHNNTNAVKLRTKDVTFTQLIQEAGYQTKLIGKFGVGDIKDATDPLVMGFDSWYGVMSNIPAHRQFPETVYRDNNIVPVPENQNGKKGLYAQEMWTSEAEAFLKESHQDPFFLFLSYTSPHAELAAPKDFYDIYKDSFEETPYIGMADGKADHYFENFYPEPVAQPNATIAAMITALDAYVGRVEKVLEQQGLADNTIIVFTSDNGAHQEGGADPSFFNASAPYRGIKRDLTDGGIHVPFIVKWPKKIAADKTNATPIAFADMLPTFSEMAGIEPSKLANLNTNGRSVFSLINGTKSELPEHLMYWEFVRQLGLDKTASVTQAIRKGNYKAVRYGAHSKLGIFNIIEDPSESEDLSLQLPELADEYKTFFDDQLSKK